MAWTTVGSIRGPQGATGATGAAGADGATGAKGETGAAGVGISIQLSVPTYADLPDDLVLADAGKAYEVQADGRLYVWSGSQFPADGSGSEWQGPRGYTGDTGAQGPTGDTGPKGDQGDTGLPGPQGIQGSQGQQGQAGTRGSLWFTGPGAPDEIGGSLPGDMYLDTASGDTYQLS